MWEETSLSNRQELNTSEQQVGDHEDQESDNEEMVSLASLSELVMGTMA